MKEMKDVKQQQKEEKGKKDDTGKVRSCIHTRLIVMHRKRSSRKSRGGERKDLI